MPRWVKRWNKKPSPGGTKTPFGGRQNKAFRIPRPDSRGESPPGSRPPPPISKRGKKSGKNPPGRRFVQGKKPCNKRKTSPKIKQGTEPSRSRPLCRFFFFLPSLSFFPFGFPVPVGRPAPGLRLDGPAVVGDLLVVNELRVVPVQVGNQSGFHEALPFKDPLHGLIRTVGGGKQLVAGTFIFHGVDQRRRHSMTPHLGMHH